MFSNFADPCCKTCRICFVLAGLILFVGIRTATAAAAFQTCGDALPLPLDQSISSHVSPRAPARYAIGLTSSGFLLIEAHGTRLLSAPPEVRFLGRSCLEEPANLPLPAIDGRHVHRIEIPGTYFVEIAAGESTDFELDAWFLPEQGPVVTVVKDDSSDGDDPPSEPMDEWNELRSRPGASPPVWREVPGHGVLELTTKPREAGDVRFHAWCPWAERPGLLATLTCSRQVQADETGTLELRRISDRGPELLGLRLTDAGRLTPELEGAQAALLDSQGRLFTSLADGDTVELGAGGYFLKVSLPLGVDVIRIDVELD